MPGKKDASDTLLDGVEAALPNFAAGAGVGLTRLALLDASTRLQGGRCRAPAQEPCVG